MITQQRVDDFFAALRVLCDEHHVDLVWEKDEDYGEAEYNAWLTFEEVRDE